MKNKTINFKYFLLDEKINPMDLNNKIKLSELDSNNLLELATKSNLIFIKINPKYIVIL